MKKLLFLLLIFIGFSLLSIAQDTLVLINGKTIIARSVDLKDYTIAYRKFDNGAKLKRIDPERVFSIKYHDGKERIVYRSDSLDPIDFSVSEMQLFIKGEKDARQFYRNVSVKGFGLATGVASCYFGFYGIIGTPLVSTFIGSFSPNVEKRLTFRPGGPAAQTAGIPSQKYLNNITGSNVHPDFGAGQKLKIGSYSVMLSGSVDSAVTAINKSFSRLRVFAANENGALKLYRTEDPSIITKGPYREGFEKRVRDYKIRSSLISGFIGFVSGIIVISVINNN